MSATADTEPPPSMLRDTIRRSSVSGRFFLIYGSAIVSLLGIALALTSPGSFDAAFPFLIPVFGSVGAMGGLVVFSTDRQKGVLEYLMAYGIAPRRLFSNYLATSLVLATVVLGIGLSVGLGLYFATGNPITITLAVLLGIYAVPMTYAAAAFATTVGMFWTALSSPRVGLNSPVGLAPFIGILPPAGTLGVLVVLGVAGVVSLATFVLIAGAASGLVALTVAVLIANTGRLLRREQLLSPAL